MVKSLLMSGIGGQGTILMSKILSEGLIRQGYDVKMCEIHGMEPYFLDNAYRTMGVD